MRKATLLLLFLFVPRWSSAQSTLYFPKGFSPAELDGTGFAIVNPGSSQARATFTLYGIGGTVVGTSVQDIPAKGQYAEVGSKLFTASQSGWVVVTSPSSGLQGFWLTGDFATFEDGAEAAPVAPDVIFPLVAGRMEVNVANPNATPMVVTFRLFGASGSEIAPSVVQPLAGLGFFQSSASSLFPGADLAQATHIRATCTMPFAGTAVIRDYVVSPSSAVVNAVDAASTLSQLNFPYVVNGPVGGLNYTTVIGVTNLAATSQTVTITFLSNQSSAQSVQRTLPPNGAIRDTAQNMFGLPPSFRDGWVRVVGSAGLTGLAAYAETAQAAIAVVPVQAAPRTSLLLLHIADLPPWLTGMALLNTNGSPATIDVYAITSTGALIGGADNVTTAKFVIPANSHKVSLLRDLIPQTQQRTGDGGFVFVRSNMPIFGIELFFTNSILASVASGGLAAGVTFTPPGPVVTPVMTALNPARAARGSALSVVGTGFDPTPTNNRIVFHTANGTTTATPTGGTTTSLTATVPQDAITGEVNVRTTVDSNTLALEVVSATGGILQNPVNIGVGQAATADIFVGASTTLNLIAIGVANVNTTNFLFAPSTVDVPRGASRDVAVVGQGLGSAAGSTLTVAGSGITISNPRFGQTTTGLPVLIVRVDADPSAATGPRNVVVTNTNLDLSALSGGIFIR